MFDMSWGEIMVIGGVALIVIGPKDLPKALRTVGQMTAKVRRMAGEFQSQFNEAMREAELEDVRKEVEGLNRDVSAATSSAFNPLQTIRDEIRGSIEQPAGSSTAIGAASVSDPGAAATAGALVDAGPVPHAEPLSAELAAASPSPIGGSSPARAGPTLAGPALAENDLHPETAALVPLAVDEPVLPAPDPSRIVTGPGLEPVAESEMPAAAAAARVAPVGAAPAGGVKEARA